MEYSVKMPIPEIMSHANRQVQSGPPCYSERGIDDMGYWEYLQALDPQVSEIRVI